MPLSAFARSTEYRNVGTGNEVYTGEGFQPKGQITFGLGDSNINRRLFGNGGMMQIGGMGDGPGNYQSVGMRGSSGNQAMHHSGTSGHFNSIAKATVASYDSNGYTWNFSQASLFTNWSAVLSLGGTDLSSINCDTAVLPTTTGNWDMASFGFDPDLIIYGIHDRGSILQEENINNATNAWGFFNATNQWCTSVSNWSFGTQNYRRGLDSPRTMIVYDRDGTTVFAADLVSFITGGFRLNVTNATTAGKRIYVTALKGTYQQKIGTATKPTSAITQNLGISFTPKALITLHARQAVQTRESDYLNCGVGVATGINGSQHACVGTRSDSAGNSNVNWHASDEVIAMVNNTAGSLDGEAHVNDYAGGVELDWTVSNAEELYFGYLALGDSAAAGGPAPHHTRRLMRGGMVAA